MKLSVGLILLGAVVCASALPQYNRNRQFGRPGHGGHRPGGHGGFGGPQHGGFGGPQYGHGGGGFAPQPSFGGSG